ncbi:MAG TPA: anthranilate phosphoribosyltransferase [Polyangia bacterium]|nr:anthranilate phosphoribosyltransferase [Polyangia bacterium]
MSTTTTDTASTAATAATATAPAAPAGGAAIRDAIAQVADRHDLSAEQMAVVVGQIMDGQGTPALIGALLVALRMKGETVSEIVGAARAMRARMTPVAFDQEVCLDTCGTGGDGSRSVNISTLASFIVAGCGVTVAKHGNRAQSSRSGSHDVIEALGIKPAPTPDEAARCLREAHLAFMFAPVHHAATRHVAGVRKELAMRTIFNLLGPLTNPCGARFHVNGIFSRERCEPLARAHGDLGSRRAMVFHGAGGLDEIAPAGNTFVAELRDGGVRVYEIGPANFGLEPADPAGLLGGEPGFNASVIVEALNGRAHVAVQNAALMAAAAGLYVADAVPDLRAGAGRAAEALRSGAARAVLEKLRGIVPLPPGTT